jgi:pSer/pThr/pTyr-binding forkhead associated (FHA) protein
MAGSAARLDVLTGKAAGMSIVIDGELVIGRLAEGAGRLADDEEISRSHARLSVDSSGRCMVEDLGSTNGTWVNGMRIATPQTLSEGDTVELGGTTMVVREVPSVEAAPSATGAASAPVQKTTGRAIPEPAPDVSEMENAELPTERVAAAEAMEEPVAEAVEAPVAQAPEEPLAEAPAAEAPLAPESAEAALPLSIELGIDFGAREVQIRLGDAEPVRLVFDGDSWRSAPSPSIEKGNPA